MPTPAATQAQHGPQLAHFESDVRFDALVAIEQQDLISIAWTRRIWVENERHASGMLQLEWTFPAA
jgi:hypothetical protein